jgi:hypothetical protein
MKYIKLFENFENEMHNESIEGLLVELKDKGFSVNFTPNIYSSWITNDIKGTIESDSIKDKNFTEQNGMYLFICKDDTEFYFYEIKEYIETVLEYLKVSGYNVKYQCFFNYDTYYISNDINTIPSIPIIRFSMKIIEVN